ncbi:MAG: EutN/CcmL family microcompartment protein [Spirochaetes bacterium]|nr:EutN/CcmL family microcompartment protein [Spirochaetota bacterium]
MRLGKVIGSIVSTVKDPKILGNTIRMVELIDIHGQSLNDYEVAVDTVGANNDDIVLLVKSSSARMTRLTEDKPIDDAIVAIVDIINMDGKELYNKKNK